MGVNMYYYKIAGLTLQSVCEVRTFEEFTCEPCEPDVTLTETDDLPPEGTDQCSGSIVHRKLPNGWYFYAKYMNRIGLYADNEYTKLCLYGTKATEGPGVKPTDYPGVMAWLVRVALESLLARRGYVSLHSAAIEVRGEAYAFSGNSGIGKSTRAGAWIEALGATLINGDRPLIDVRNRIVYGVPWDGKEKCFRNVHYPLKAICEVRRSDTVYARSMSFSQRRKLLMRQCFMPMWDTETAAIQMSNLKKLAASAAMVRVFCGPTAEDAKKLYEVLQKQDFLMEEEDMRAKQGFVLRHVVDEYILMPTGDNISKFNGTVIFNEVAAFVWDKLQNPVSRDDLVEAILNEFEVERDVAAADLDALLGKLREYGVIEED